MARQVDELRKLTKEELVQLVIDSVKKLNAIRLKFRLGQASPNERNEFRRIKLTVARAKTVLREMELVN